MVDVNPSNDKLEKRAINMIRDIAEVEAQAAVDAFHESGRHVKTAVLMLVLNIDAEEAKKLVVDQPNIREILSTNKG